MPLPVALGATSKSSQRLSTPVPHPDDSDDGISLQPLELYQTVAVAACPEQEWSARVSIGYYDLIRTDTGKRDTTVAEVRISIGPLAKNLSPRVRETVHHIRLPDGAASGDYPPSLLPSVTFSADRRNLALLLFHPHQQSSAVIVFQLRRPRQDNSSLPDIPLPRYVSETPSLESPAVATHPKLSSAWGICSMTDLPGVYPSVLLCATLKGELLWIDYKTQQIIASGSLGGGPTVELQANCRSVNSGTIIAVRSNGAAVVAKWQLQIQGGGALGHNLSQGPRRASTGMEAISHLAAMSMNDDDDDDSDFGLSTPKQSPAKRSLRSGGGDGPDRKAPPTRSKSSDLIEAFKTRFSPNPKQQSQSDKPTGMGKAVATRRAVSQRDSMKRHMDHFVLHELQSKTDSLLDRPITPQRVRNQRRRRTEILSTESTQNSFQREMSVRTLAQLYHVQSAAFCSPSVLCVLYRPGSLKTSRGYPRAAQALGISEDEESLVELAPLELAQDRIEDVSNFDSEIEDQGHVCGIEHDAQSGSLLVSTLYFTTEGHRKRISCVWNWRSNVVGFLSTSTVEANLIWVRCFWSRDFHRGMSLCTIEALEQTSSEGSDFISLRKLLTSTGVLSPSPSTTLQVHEPSTLMMTGTTVSYPVCTRPTAKDIYEIEWKESLVPPAYVNEVGSPTVAAIGREHGRALAVASSSGICILDILRNEKWRLFGSEAEEKAFQVIAMAWWEGPVSESLANDNEMNEDLLVAVIQLKNGSYFLSCWSPNRLDATHQLIEDISTDKSGFRNSSLWGVALPQDSAPVSLSLLADPSTERARRAVALVSCTSRNSKEVYLMPFQMQVTINKSSASAENYAEQKPLKILASCPLRGIANNGGRHSPPISSVFLASASFRFDLKNSNQSSSLDDIFAIVGIIRTPGGLEACVLSKSKGMQSCYVVESIDIAKFYLGDTVISMDAEGPFCSVGSEAFVWAIQLLDGELLSWSVPYINYKHSEVISSPVIAGGSLSKWKGLEPPVLVCNVLNGNDLLAIMFGTRCIVGNASDWIEQSTSINQSELSMGHVPSSSFGCVLSVGQTSKKFHRTIPGGFDTDSFANDFLDYEIYAQSDFIMGPPAFVPSFFALFLEAAYLKTEIPVLEEMKVEATVAITAKEEERLSDIEGHIVNRLKNSPNEDAVMMALRLLIIRSVETLADSHKKLIKQGTEDSHTVFKLALALYSGIVRVVRECTSGLQFASLFLEVGRQIEPSCLSHLFPLPQSKLKGDDESASTTRDDILMNEPEEEDDSISSSHPINIHVNKYNACTVTDLFDLSMKEGCLAASTSALPLLSSKRKTRRSCETLIKYSLDEFIINVTSDQSLSFDSTEESRRVLGDIFRFGMKLEEAAVLDELGDDISVESEHVSSEDMAAMTPQQIVAAEQKRKLMCIGGRNSSILHYLGASMFSPAGDLLAEEEQIKRAASSFIEKEFEDIDRLDEDADRQKGLSEMSLDDGALIGSELQGVASIVGETVVDLFCSSDSRHPWRSILSLAKLLLTESEQENNNSLNDHVADLVEGIQHEDLEALVPSDFESGGSDDRTDFVIQLIASCSEETTKEESLLILDLIYLLLHRIEEFPFQEDDEMLALVTAGLSVAGMVTATVSDRITDFLSTLDQRCALVQCFDLVEAQLDMVV